MCIQIKFTLSFFLNGNDFVQSNIPHNQVVQTIKLISNHFIKIITNSFGYTCRQVTCLSCLSHVVYHGSMCNMIGILGEI